MPFQVTEAPAPEEGRSPVTGSKAKARPSPDPNPLPKIETSWPGATGAPSGLNTLDTPSRVNRGPPAAWAGPIIQSSLVRSPVSLVPPKKKPAF